MHAIVNSFWSFVLRIKLYLSSFIMACKLADDSIVGGKVLHEDGRDFSEVSRTSGSYRRDIS